MVSLVLSIIYIAGIVQGIIISIALLKPKLFHNKNNRILLMLILCMTVVMISYLMVINNQVQYRYYLSSISTTCWFAVSPLFYLYIKAGLNREFKFSKSQALLFIFPIYNIIQLVLSILGFSFSVASIINDYWLYANLWLLAYLLHGLLFTGAALAMLQKTNNIRLVNLKPFLFMFFITLIAITTIVLFKSNDRELLRILERVLVLIFATFVLYLGIKSIQSSNQLTNGNSDKYFNSKLGDDESKKLLEKLNRTTTKLKPYLDKDLTLSGLAKLTSIKENDLSQIFSQHLNSGFYEYIRDYRLREVELRLKDPKYSYLKIVAIANDCGFKSKASFYKAFKEKHGITPSQYLANMKTSTN